jgi:hypothetical protein
LVKKNRETASQRNTHSANKDPLRQHHSLISGGVVPWIGVASPQQKEAENKVVQDANVDFSAALFLRNKF